MWINHTQNIFRAERIALALVVLCHIRWHQLLKPAQYLRPRDTDIDELIAAADISGLAGFLRIAAAAGRKANRFRAAGDGCFRPLSRPDERAGSRAQGGRRRLRRL